MCVPLCPCVASPHLCGMYQCCHLNTYLLRAASSMDYDAQFAWAPPRGAGALSEKCVDFACTAGGGRSGRFTVVSLICADVLQRRLLACCCDLAFSRGAGGGARLPAARLASIAASKRLQLHKCRVDATHTHNLQGEDAHYMTWHHGMPGHVTSVKKNFPAKKTSSLATSKCCQGTSCM